MIQAQLRQQAVFCDILSNTASRPVSMQAHHTAFGWLVVKSLLHVLGSALLQSCLRFPAWGRPWLPAWERCLGTCAVPVQAAYQFPAWEHLPVPCLGMFASPCLGLAPDQCPRTPFFLFCVFEHWPGMLFLSSFLMLICASSSLICHAIPCPVKLFLQWLSSEPEAKQKEWKQTPAGAENGWLLENERTRKKREWKEGWFSVVDGRSSWTRVKALNVGMHIWCQHGCALLWGPWQS